MLKLEQRNQKEGSAMVDTSSDRKNPSSQSSPDFKPKIPERPPISGKPPLLPRPTALKLNSPGKTEPDKSTNDFEKKVNVPLVNGTDNDNHLVMSTKGEVTAEEKVAKRTPPRRPSPLTRLSRYKPLGGPTLLEMIEQKLTEESINLAQEPYTRVEVMVSRQMRSRRSVLRRQSRDTNRNIKRLVYCQYE